VKSLKPEEEWARRAISLELRVPVRQHDDGTGHAMYDLEIVYPDKSAASVEVTSSVDATATELWKAAYRAGRWEDVSLAGGWSIHIDPYVPKERRLNLRRELPKLLRALEDLGIREYPSAQIVPEADALAEGLGVRRAWQHDTDFRGSIYVYPDVPIERRGGYGNPSSDAIAAWVTEYLTADERADVRRKLADSGADERHAFIIAGTEPEADFTVTDPLMRDAPPPVAGPALPPEVTHVWVASVWGDSDGFRWTPENGWTAFKKP
jgi:hypothetical protein